MTISETVARIKASDRFLILTHRRPDGDTLGSAAALCRGLRASGRTAFLYKNPQVTETYLPWVRDLFAPEGYVPDCVVSVDIATEDLFPEGWQGEVQLALDHHPSNTSFAEYSMVRGELASCGELIYELLMELNGHIDGQCAELLYIAVSTDTGCFCYGNTSSACLRAAAALIDAGAKNATLNKLLFRSKSIAGVKLEGEINSRMEFFKNGRAALATITLDMLKRAGAIEDDCEDIASLTGRVRGVRVGMTIRELERSKCKLSVRTTGEVNANALCARFGGGGHAMASGATIDEPIERVRELLLAALDDCWGE